MTENTLLAQLIANADTNSEMDNNCKKLLSHKIILAWILKYAVEEYAEHSINAIAERYIMDDSVCISQSILQQEVKRKSNSDKFLQVHDKQLIGLNTENKPGKEGRVTFDLLFRVRIPSTRKISTMLINIEAQDNFYPGYPLIKRAIYYCCRMITNQYGTIFQHAQYNKLQKVYSIWICTNPPKYRENTMVKYELSEKTLLGKVRELRKNFDLLSILIIGLKKNTIQTLEKNKLIDMLSILLSSTLSVDEKENILENQFHLPMTTEIKEDINNMCNISRSVKIEGIKEGFANGLTEGKTIGISEGKAIGLQEALQNIMKNLKLSAEQAMDILNIPLEERQNYLKNI